MIKGQSFLIYTLLIYIIEYKINLEYVIIFLLSVPGFPCNEDHECVEGAECVVSNQTHPVTGVTGRQCICRLGEDDDECNGKD